jgi:hypothetical protein
MDMKSHLRLPIAALFLVISLWTASAQYPAPPAIDPATGLPIAVIPRESAAKTFSPVIDPMTGLPIVLSEWKHPDWKDPKNVLPEVMYDNVPVVEVARHLSETFKDEFDILLPRGFGDVDTSVSLKLKNVKASEVFFAMNLLFENDRTPLRWELKLNGNRQIALLRVLEDLARFTAFPSPTLKRVYFVGDLIEGNNSGMSLKDVHNTVMEVASMTSGQPESIKIHNQAQLIVVTGTPEQIEIIEQTLTALRARALRLEAKSKIIDETKSGGDASAKETAPTKK